MNDNPLEQLTQQLVATVVQPASRIVQPAENGTQAGAVKDELNYLVQALNRSTSATTQNTDAIGNNVSAIQSLGKSLLSKTGLGNVSGGGGFSFGLSPIVSLIGKLFGGKKEEPPPELPKFNLPTALSIDGGITGGATGSLSAVQYGQDSLPRSIVSTTTMEANHNSAQRSVPVAQSAPQITFNVQAIDSRSFLDHSSEIASALKSALLHSHDVSDVLSE